MAARPRPVRKGFAFPKVVLKSKSGELSLAAQLIRPFDGKAEPYRTGCGTAAGPFIRRSRECGLGRRRSVVAPTVRR